MMQFWRATAPPVAVLALLWMAAPTVVHAQGDSRFPTTGGGANGGGVNGGGGGGNGRRGTGGRGGNAPAQSPKAAAPIDITGNWVSIVTEDWRYRMVTPPKGMFGGVPLNPEGRKVMNGWDPAKDEAAGQQCR